MEIKQYQIILVNLDPTVGSEIQKTRPCVVVSPNELNRHLQTVVVTPITSTSKPYPTRIKINQPPTKGWIVVDQIKTIDKQRIIRVLGELTEIMIVQTKAVIKETFVD